MPDASPQPPPPPARGWEALARAGRQLAAAAALAAIGLAAGVAGADWRLRQHAWEPQAAMRLAERLALVERRLAEVEARLAAPPPPPAAAAEAPASERTLRNLPLRVLRAAVELAAGNRGRAADLLDEALQRLAAAGLPADAAGELEALLAAARDDVRLGRAAATARLDLLWQRLLELAGDEVPPGEAGAPAAPSGAPAGP